MVVKFTVTPSKVLLLSLAVILGNAINVKVHLFGNVFKHSFAYPKDSLLNFTELSGQYGFASEEHKVITDDGYILTIFRIRNKTCKQFKPSPVILMHGLLQSSDGWLDAGPNAGLAYLIADACYDLWVGNQRGNYYSRSHVTLDPDEDPKFWQFCVDEIGMYDLPSTIDYVLRSTSKMKLNYIGFSQGAGIFLVMCSEKPGYCDKVNIMVALAPASRHTHSKSVMFRKVCESANALEKLLTSTGFHELFSKGALAQETWAVLCKSIQFSEAICGTVLSLLDSSHPGSIAAETLRVMVGHAPAGTSARNMARYGQSIQTEQFQKFDYGRVGNLETYGSEDPPSFNLSAVTAPVVTLYGRNDYIVDPVDVFWLVNRLPNVLETLEIHDPLWNHFDFAYSQHISKMVFPKVNLYLEKYG